MFAIDDSFPDRASPPRRSFISRIGYLHYSNIFDREIRYIITRLLISPLIISILSIFLNSLITFKFVGDNNYISKNISSNFIHNINYQREFNHFMDISFFNSYDIFILLSRFESINDDQFNNTSTRLKNFLSVQFFYSQFSIMKWYIVTYIYIYIHTGWYSPRTILHSRIPHSDHAWFNHLLGTDIFVRPTSFYSNSESNYYRRHSEYSRSAAPTPSTVHGFCHHRRASKRSRQRRGGGIGWYAR